MNDSNSRLVYSTNSGRIDEPKAAPVRPQGDGIVRIQRQTSGRKGKGVCLITGIDQDDAELTKLAAELKKKCGCGGAVKDGVIEIQGDKRDLIKSLLEAKGMKVAFTGTYLSETFRLSDVSALSYPSIRINSFFVNPFACKTVPPEALHPLPRSTIPLLRINNCPSMWYMPGSSCIAPRN